jgi:hypothetical protein
MIFVDQMKEGLNIMLHPTEANYESHGIGGSLTFYYKLSLIPLILYIIFSTLSTNPLFSMLRGIISIWVVAPIGFFIASLLYHAIGKLFKAFKNPYQNTFSAMVYGVIPSIMFIWIQPIPIINLLVIIFEIWAFIVMVFALAKLQSTKPLTAFGIIIATFVVIIILVAIFAIALMPLGVIPTTSIHKI